MRGENRCGVHRIIRVDRREVEHQRQTEQTEVDPHEEQHGEEKPGARGTMPNPPHWLCGLRIGYRLHDDAR